MSHPDNLSLGTTVSASTPHWEPRPRPAAGAPNVVLIVFDDTGFAHFGCYGSDIETPNIDALAANGLRYTNFHTTALCSPTRACLLSGRNHHSVGMRFLSNVDTGFSNCRGVISPQAATLAEVLTSGGYSTFALGKWHLANMEDCGPAGPMDHWPLGRGFDRFYGFLGGATDQFSPELVIDNRPVDPPADPAYHLSQAMVDEAISMISSQRTTSARPFMAYLAFGATHSPHQAPAEYLRRYRGRYDQGWDITRQAWFERQRELGVIPPEAVLSPRNPGIPAWTGLSETERKLFARMQEVFAGFLHHTDAQIGRLVDFLRIIGELDNTLLVLLSDNGASQEGGKNGVINELAFFNRMPQRVDDMADRIDDIGGPNLYNNYPKGWSQAGNCPLRFYKQNTYEGGIRDPLIVHWPAQLKTPGTLRHQYHHAIDIMPTILDCVGMEAPAEFKGVAQIPVAGISMRYSFDKADTASRRHTQYYEMLGHRALYHAGWKAVTLHQPGTPFDDDIWHLYHVDTDFAEINDLADTHSERLARMKELWWREAGRYNVLPLDDRSSELFAMRRPDSELSRNILRYLPGTAHIDRFAMPDIRNRSWTITAHIEHGAGDEGVLVACGARTGGHSFYVQNGHLVFEYNALGQSTAITADRALQAGRHTVKAQFKKSAEHEGTLTLIINEEPSGHGTIRLLPWRQTLYGMDIGRDVGSTVGTAYKAPFAYCGTLHFIEYETQNDRDDLRAAAAVAGQNCLIDQ
ncbi:MAG: sulfatase-like hydrolase/transferase [Gammaproteobacteria bacterium]|nr:sulfatase-like hydrolase/transferase [Gammaproteobacteria bacterium]